MSRKASKKPQPFKIIEAPFSKRIFDNFCSYCKYKEHASSSGCSLFMSKSAICVRFEFENDQLKKEYEEETLHNWAVTIWLNKGKSLEDIHAMSEEKLKGVLSNHHYKSFDKEEKERKELLKQALKEREERMLELSPET